MRVIPILAAALMSAPFAVQAEEFSQTLAVNANVDVEISNIAGTVKIAAWDRNEVEVKANYTRGVDRIDVDEGRSRVVIRVEFRRGGYGYGRGYGGSADLTVRVPRRADLDVSAISASVESDGVQGEQRLKSVSGGVTTDVNGRDLEVKTVSGPVTLRGRDKSADIRINTISGDVRLTNGRGEVDVTTVSGRVVLDMDDAHAVRAHTTSGSLSVRARKVLADATFDAETISGNFRFDLRLPKGMQYEVTTFSGDIDNCFGAEAVRTSRYAPGARLEGRRGEGEARVRVRTMSGRVDLCDR